MKQQSCRHSFACEHSSCLVTVIEEFYRITLLNPPNLVYPWQHIIVMTLEQVRLVLRPQG